MAKHTNSLAADTVGQVIRKRRTLKVLSDVPLPTDRPGMTLPQALESLCAIAGWAPFHKPADRSHQVKGGLDGIVPWRLHVVNAEGCRVLRQELIEQRDDSKLPKMLAAADAVIFATWLPDPAPRKSGEPEGTPQIFSPSLKNMEHLAAASAAVQNLLLAATARGIENYWSSGGALREPAMFDRLSIPTREILLGALFLFPAQADLPDHVTLKTSTLRSQRGDASGWSRHIEL
ncbi:MAG: nitroreductase family protein [Planctomycetota bacterium]